MRYLTSDIMTSCDQPAAAPSPRGHSVVKVAPLPLPPPPSKTPFRLSAEFYSDAAPFRERVQVPEPPARRRLTPAENVRLITERKTQQGRPLTLLHLGVGWKKKKVRAATEGGNMV